MIFDFDDAIFLGEKRQKHIEWVCKNAAWVTVGNEYLAEFVRKVTDRVTVIPSVVDADKYRPAWHESVQTQLRVGWLGSDLSIRETLFPYIDMLSRLQRRIGFQFVIVSKPEPRLPSADLNWQYVEWSPSIEENIAEYLDVGLMPLVDDEFQRGKCGMKILQYMAGGIPAIASPIGVNRNIIQHGVTGFLANSEAEWGAAIEALQKSPALRGKIGQAGRQHCEQNYSLKVWLPKLLTVLEKVAVRKATSG
jgi:glycosyltransferase involved in cell wall biosynthesis